LAWVSFILSGFVLLSFFSVFVAMFANRPLPEIFAYSAIASQYVSLAALPCAITRCPECGATVPRHR
jgi:hypothetical protein